MNKKDILMDLLIDDAVDEARPQTLPLVIPAQSVDLEVTFTIMNTHKYIYRQIHQRSNMITNTNLLPLSIVNQQTCLDLV